MSWPLDALPALTASTYAGVRRDLVRDAAPELLHACRLIAENAPLVAAWLKENDPGAYEQVRTAIALATGETK